MQDVLQLKNTFSSHLDFLLSKAPLHFAHPDDTLNADEMQTDIFLKSLHFLLTQTRFLLLFGFLK